MYVDDDSYYDVAQICENGHVTNGHVRDYPAHNQVHCDKCGSRTITKCPACETEIRGAYNVPGVIGFSDYAAPAFCYKCGEPFPWTAATLRAAEDLADEMDALSAGEKESLKKTLPDLVRETPRARLAETRFKKFMKKAGKESWEGMRAILTDIVSETVRKTLFGV